MLAILSLRLAAGLMAALLLLSPAQVNPRFYRAQFWIVLGLTVVAAVFAGDVAGLAFWTALGSGVALAFAGSVVWALEGEPGGRVLIVLTACALSVGLGVAEWNRPDSGEFGMRLVGDATSAALLGTALTAMLLGHFYLIAPAMSLAPLMRLLAALAAAIVLRMALAAVGLWSWTADHSLTNLTDGTVLWLPLRWGLGFVGPLVLAWMAWRTSRIRSTQSATGILYVVVILCFLGEVTGLLLWSSTGVLI